MINNMKIGVVIPCFKVKQKIISVIDSIPSSIDKVYVVDDKCPDNSGNHVLENIQNHKVEVLFREKNGGVGAATLTGYQKAILDKVDIIVKIDGDGQMDPQLIDLFVIPISKGLSDYAKGNRFFRIDQVQSMPIIRKFGNIILSFLNKLSSGYWHIFDPTNGYTAIHAAVAANLPFDKISTGYFFESDILFHLGLLSASVSDIPMNAIYDDEKSNLKITRVIPEFFFKHLRNFLKRVFYSYFLNDFNIASVELLLGFLLLTFGSGFGLYHWILSIRYNALASSGTVMLAALPTILGLQLILAFLNFDMNKLRVTSILHLFLSHNRNIKYR